MSYLVGGEMSCDLRQKHLFAHGYFLSLEAAALQIVEFQHLQHVDCHVLTAVERTEGPRV